MNLLDFVQHQMRMSHIYQPVMIKALLTNGGRMSTREIAQEILIFDNSQMEYYEQVVNNFRIHSATRFECLGTPPKESSSSSRFHPLRSVEAGQ